MTAGSIVYESPSPNNLFCYSPSIIYTPSGKLLCTIDLGGNGVSKIKSNSVFAKDRAAKHYGIGYIFESSDNGNNWTKIGEFDFIHARLFRIDENIYLIGHHGDVCIRRTTDEGKTWTDTIKLTTGQKWHSSACNVHITDDSINLALEQRLLINDIKGWNVSGLSPQVFRAKRNSDLLNPDSWSLSKSITFRDVFNYDNSNQFGIPFYPCLVDKPKQLTEELHNAPIGWLETNIVQILDPNHIWFDDSKKTYHLLLRTHTGSTNIACLLKIQEDIKGQLIPSLEKSPNGNDILFINLPGGHLKFFVFYDKDSSLFWLISNQATDSMRKLNTMNKVERFELPNNERHRLQLHFSKNLIDWCFATMIVSSTDEKLSCNYPSAVVLDDDLHIICRSANHKAKNPQYSNLITHHIVSDFRKFVY